jgi:hypothetical protein
MTDIEPKEVFRSKAIALINEYRQQRGLMPIQFLEIITPEISALIRSIQLHEKTKKELADFKQKVSDAAERAVEIMDIWCDDVDFLRGFIIPKPKRDPLVEAIESVLSGFESRKHAESYAHHIRAKLDNSGFEIREKGQ